MPDPKGLLVVPVGLDASGLPRALGVDAGDRLKVAIDAASAGLVGTSGWIGGAWQKNPLLMGYSARISGRVQATSTGAGSTTVNATTVPAGEVWIIDSLAAYHDDATARLTVLYAYNVDSGVASELKIDVALATRVAQQVLSPIVLAPGDYANCVCFALANNQHVTIAWWGRRVDIDQ